MAREWKEAAERNGGVEGAKPPDAHAFLQHLATFAVADRDDRPLYRRIVVSFSWRRQMPRLALTLGLEEQMPGIFDLCPLYLVCSSSCQMQELQTSDDRFRDYQVLCKIGLDLPLYR
jgi:hypothetical protein